MRYLVQERIFSLTTDFWIEDEDGNRVFFVDGRALSLRETFELKDANGDLHEDEMRKSRERSGLGDRFGGF